MERHHQTEAARHVNRNDLYAVVTDTMRVIQSGFSSREEAEMWVEDRLSGYPEPEWSEDEVEIEAI